jgi:hypothetical protein
MTGLLDSASLISRAIELPGNIAANAASSAVVAQRSCIVAAIAVPLILPGIDKQFTLTSNISALGT